MRLPDERESVGQTTPGVRIAWSSGRAGKQELTILNITTLIAQLSLEELP